MEQIHVTTEIPLIWLLGIIGIIASTFVKMIYDIRSLKEKAAVIKIAADERFKALEKSIEDKANKSDVDKFESNLNMMNQNIAQLLKGMGEVGTKVDMILEFDLTKKKGE